MTPPEIASSLQTIVLPDGQRANGSHRTSALATWAAGPPQATRPVPAGRRVSPLAALRRRQSRGPVAFWCKERAMGCSARGCRGLRRSRRGRQGAEREHGSGSPASPDGGEAVFPLDHLEEPGGRAGAAIGRQAAGRRGGRLLLLLFGGLAQFGSELLAQLVHAAAPGPRQGWGRRLDGRPQVSELLAHAGDRLLGGFGRGARPGGLALGPGGRLPGAPDLATTGEGDGRGSHTQYQRDGRKNSLQRHLPCRSLRGARRDPPPLSTGSVSPGHASAGRSGPPDAPGIPRGRLDRPVGGNGPAALREARPPAERGVH